MSGVGETGGRPRQSPLARLRSRVRHRALSWSRRRSGRDGGVIELTARRVYILPTALGATYAAMLFTMLLAGLNYANNLALLMTFVLAATGWVAMQECHRNLVGLTLIAGEPRSPHAGEPAMLTYRLTNDSLRARHDVTLRVADGGTAIVSVPAGGAAGVTLEVPSRVRGLLQVARVRVESRFPLGLCRAWSWLHVEQPVIVYPRVGPASPHPADSAQQPGAGPTRAQPGEEDVSGLRAYRPGDPVHRIAWKAYARGAGLNVREMNREAAAPACFDFEHVAGRTTEERIERLTRLVVEAAARGEAYGLRLPDAQVATGRGQAHRHECLTRLALFRPPPDPGAADGG